MRPGPIRPGDKILEQSLTESMLASMRPGPIRPGDTAEVFLAAVAVNASMRPGPIRPGDPRPVASALPRWPGFNEARADSPGRWPLRRYIRQMTKYRFNEARADSPGRYPRPPRHVLRHPEASMRPGPIRPGDDTNAFTYRASMRPGPIRPGDQRQQINWTISGSGFNEARADSPGRWRTRCWFGEPLPGFNEARADSPGRCSRRRQRCR